MKRMIAVAVGLILPACGGDGSSPAGPSAPTPPNSLELVAAPASTEPIAFQFPGLVTPTPNIRFDILFNGSASGAAIAAQFRTADGNLCVIGTAAGLSFPPAGQGVSLTTFVVFLDTCGESFTTNTVEVVLGADGTTLIGPVTFDRTLMWVQG